MSAGRVIEIYKEVGRPRVFAEQFAIADFEGTHGLGHTRMATESRVTTAGSLATCTRGPVQWATPDRQGYQTSAYPRTRLVKPSASWRTWRWALAARSPGVMMP